MKMPTHPTKSSISATSITGSSRPPTSTRRSPDFPDVRLLREFYGLLPQPPTDPFQFFLWEILSSDALPARRDLAWQALRRIPALTPDSVFRAPLEKLEDAVGLAGHHRGERIENIRSTAGEFKRHRDLFDADAFAHAGLRAARRALQRLTHLPSTMRQLALLYAGGYEVVPVDDAAARVVARIDGTDSRVQPAGEPGRPHLLSARERHARRRHARKVLVQQLPRDVGVYREMVTYLRHHGEHTCTPTGPHCGVCPWAAACAFAQNL